MNKEQFTKLYYESPDEEVAKLLNISSQTVRNYASKLGLKRKGRGYLSINDKRLRIKTLFPENVGMKGK